MTHIAYPRAQAEFTDFNRTLQRHVLPGFVPATPPLARTDIVVTQGSCFAENIHHALLRAGIQSIHCQMTESGNTPLANRLFFEDVSTGRNDTQRNHASSVTPEIIASTHHSISQASVFIFTIGLIYSPFRDGRFVFSFDPATADQLEWTPSSLEESVDDITAIISMLKAINPGIKVVLTLSPIPIAGYFGRHSAVVADCVSKSTLRTAIDKVLDADPPDVSYWPSFEAIRWLSGHMGPFFGAEGQDQRHPGASYIQAITDTFVAAYFKP